MASILAAILAVVHAAMSPVGVASVVVLAAVLAEIFAMVRATTAAVETGSHHAALVRAIAHAPRHALADTALGRVVISRSFPTHSIRRRCRTLEAQHAQAKQNQPE